MSMVWRAALAFAGAAAALAAAALGQGVAGVASQWVEISQARARILAGPSPVAPAKSYLAGVEIAMAEGWKTYWRTPGDAGVPPSFEWEGSTNVASIEVRYPAPVRLVEPGAETLGYKGAVIFPVEVMPKDAAKPVGLALVLSLGICRDICIPAEVRLSLTLPPSLLEGRPVPALIAALGRVPHPAGAASANMPRLEQATAILDGERPRLVLDARFPSGSRGGDVFIEAPGGIYIPQPKRAPEGSGDTLRFEVDLSRGDNARDLKNKTLTLTLVSDAGAAEATWTVP
jgi:DsbC/DsbD-like thiol-disulfide interchange protein